MSRLFLNTFVALLSAAVVACGGGGGGGSGSDTCTGTTLPATVTYASGTYAQTVAATITPTVTGIPSGCDASKISYTATSLPAGMAIAPATGVISGTPTTLGASTPVVTLAVSGYSGTVAASPFTLTIEMWRTKTSNHGLSNLVTTHLLTVGTDLYLLGSQQVGNNYQPLLYKSTDSGATWTNTGTAPSFTSLINFAATTDGTNLYLAGGRTSDSTVAAASYTYNDNVLKFTPGAGGAAGSWSTVSTSPFLNGSGQHIGGAELSAMAYDTITSTMYVASGERKGLVTPIWHRTSNNGLSWFALTGAPQQMGHCLAVSSTGVVHSLGGFGVSGASYADLKSDFVTTDRGNTWTEKSATTALASPYQMGCGFIGSTLYAVGGTTKSGTTTVGSVRRSTDSGTTWTADPASATFATRAKAGLAVLAGKLLVFGGSSNGTNTLTDVIEGTP